MPSYNTCRNPSFGLATKAKGLQGAGLEVDSGVTSHASRSAKNLESVREWTLTLPSELPRWELGESWSPKGTPKTSESDLRGQISMTCDSLYINGKLLKCRCLKWARMAHLDIWNTSYGQKKARESNSRESANFDSRDKMASHKVYYKGEGGDFPKFGPWWVLCVQVPVASPNTQGCPEC